MLSNIPSVKLGMIAVSRDCFIISLSKKRAKKIQEKALANGVDLFLSPTVVENEKDALKALEEIKEAKCNALIVYLGNFGPETPETILAQKFAGPVMYIAAAEEGDLINGRGDAYCGMLNCSYNLNLRHIKAYIPENPVCDADESVEEIKQFIPIARAIIGLSKLKIITFGPRPQDFFACNAPIKALYDLGVEIEENSELDLLVSYKAHANDPRIEETIQSMVSELGLSGNKYPDLLPRLAQFELTLLDWADSHKGAREYVAFANKCWPAFPEAFGFEPCYVNSRMASRGIPVACEVDIYGALSEYIGTLLSAEPVTLLDINNTVPKKMYEESILGKYNYALRDTFMGFHCGNTPSSCLSCGEINYQIIQNRLLENGNTPDITRGTLEGDIKPGNITFFRLHSNADTSLQAYVCEGEVLPVKTNSFGGIGVFAIPEMGRFYRHVLVEHHYPHHGAVAFDHIGNALFKLFKYYGINEIHYNRPSNVLYEGEGPFKCQR